MNVTSTRFLYPIFFISGAAGLMYEIVWTRLLVFIFGATTNSIVAVLTAFLGGLALGSLLFGRLADQVDQNSRSLLRLYAKLEVGVAVTAVLSVVLLQLIMPLYAGFSDGTEITTGLMIIKFLLTIIILLVPTILMGATLPVLVNFAQVYNKHLEKNVSILYAINTFGAVVGVLLAGFVFLELTGLLGTLWVGVALNFVAAALAFSVNPDGLPKTQQVATSEFSTVSPNSSSVLTILYILGLSGFISIAYQVLWTRMLTPVTGTFIYALSAILAVYLSGLAVGSVIYYFYLVHNPRRELIFGSTQVGIGFFALISVYVMAVALPVPRHALVFLVILPATIFMGISFPAAIATLKGTFRSGEIVGLAYVANTLGAIAGGFLVSFFFIPAIGSSQSVLLLSIVNFILAVWLFRMGRSAGENWRGASHWNIGLAVVALFIFVYERDGLHDRVTQERINWARANNIESRFAEDDAVSVFAYNNKQENSQDLIINGIRTTGKVLETKLMAHMPVAFHRDPHDLLIIAFGMGTTFRSALLHDIQVDVVELAPTVPQMFTLFHDDAQQVLDNPKGRIIINDGRNYVSLARKQYDIVTIDPPPPFNAAGTTVLYSKEFYEDISKILQPGGIISQWLFFGTREDDIAMATKSFLDVFPYVLVFVSPAEGEGVYLIGTHSELSLDIARIQRIFAMPEVVKDLAEVNVAMKGSDIMNLRVTDRDGLLKFVGNLPAITDNNPRSEYFLIRRATTDYPRMTRDLLRERVK